ncbi:hypothetical protein PGTUg99_027229 [Puccinia graminis f. sp. tritici]|uniref:Uncharacterized protein n=1 Tax=Puccinia graminis f. sp. tritici TaxID=56615 RepID=A0A5B0S185_PUCGR|nr:hypothetical protein PGTUg99_027229 [Puccinia graminis f. sp. tritici]
MLSSSSQIIPPHCQRIRLQQTEAHPFTFTPTHQPSTDPKQLPGPFGSLFFQHTRSATHQSPFWLPADTSSPPAPPPHPVLPSPPPPSSETNIKIRRSSFFSAADNRTRLHLDRVIERVIFLFFSAADSQNTSRPPHRPAVSLPQPTPRPIDQNCVRHCFFFFWAGQQTVNRPTITRIQAQQSSRSDFDPPTIDPPLASPSLHLDLSIKHSSSRRLGIFLGCQ